MLRGGSFAVDPVACRGTFRNWDYPIRRQIFSGFRTPGTPIRRPSDVPYLAFLDPRSRSAGCSWTRRTACSGSRRRHGVNGTEPSTPMVSGSVGTPRVIRRPRGTGGPGRSRRPVLRRSGAGGALGRAARGGARRDRGGRGQGGRGGAVRRGPLAVQPQRRDQRLAALPGTPGPDPAACRAAVHGGTLRLGPRLGVGPEPAARRRRGGPGARRHGSRRRGGGPRLTAQPPAHQRRGDRRHRLGRHALVSDRARPAHRRGLRAVRRRSALAGGTGPHPAGREPHGRPAHPAQGREAATAVDARTRVDAHLASAPTKEPRS